MSVRVIENGSATDRVLEVHGVLDLRAAEAVISVAAAQPPWARLIIDLSRAGTCHDSALARLVEGLEERHPRFRGVRVHQARLLGYLGVRREHVEDAGSEPEAR